MLAIAFVLSIVAVAVVTLSIARSQMGEILSRELSPVKVAERKVAQEALATLAGFKMKYGRWADLYALWADNKITFPSYITPDHLLGGNITRVMRVIRRTTPGLPTF